MSRWRAITAGVFIAAASVLLAGRSAVAVESATGFYLLGSKGSMAGFTPPPGTYFQDIKYYYAGSLGLNVLNGVLLTDVDAKAYFELPTLLWIAPRPVLGGNVGLGVIVPVGWKDIRASAELNLPPPLGIVVNANIQSDDTAFGDPVLTALIGWHSGNWHWNLSTLVNVPVGFWELRNPSNIGFNRWGIDVSGAATWLDPKRGLEVSGAAGVTFNFENPDTDYKSGSEFHLEFAVVQSLRKDLGIGIAGYHYRQLTGDSGSGARLGPFKGEVTAIGPVLNYNFLAGKTPISTSLRWLHEFDAENRAEGEAAFLTVTVPLAGLLH
jgi:hypothetical protein